MASKRCEMNPAYKRAEIGVGISRASDMLNYFALFLIVGALACGPQGGNYNSNPDPTGQAAYAKVFGVTGYVGDGGDDEHDRNGDNKERVAFPSTLLSQPSFDLHDKVVVDPQLHGQWIEERSPFDFGKEQDIQSSLKLLSGGDPTKFLEMFLLRRGCSAPPQAASDYPPVGEVAVNSRVTIKCPEGTQLHKRKAVVPADVNIQDLEFKCEDTGIDGLQLVAEDKTVLNAYHCTKMCDKFNLHYGPPITTTAQVWISGAPTRDVAKVGERVTVNCVRTHRIVGTLATCGLRGRRTGEYLCNENTKYSWIGYMEAFGYAPTNVSGSSIRSAHGCEPLCL